MENVDNKVLLRQLKKAKIKSIDDLNQENFSKFLSMVQESYTQMDEMVYRLERSLKLSNKELQDLNDNLEKKIILEVNQNREKDKKLIEQSRSAALGEMIGNIAHQWRQPLSAITSTSTGMIVQTELGLVDINDMKKSFENIVDYTNFLTHTIEDFREFFKKDKEIKTFEINECLNKTINIIAASYKDNNIEIINKNPEIKAMSSGYQNEIAQVFLNVLNNARDILIEKNVENKKVIIEYDSNDSLYCISFTDNAGGVPQNILPKIFDPYFTTKHKSQGTGIGLYMCKQIVEKHSNGTISAENVEFEMDGIIQKGACFKVCLQKDVIE